MLWIRLLRFFFSSRRRHTRLQGDWSSDVCSSDLLPTKKGLSALRWVSEIWAMRKVMALLLLVPISGCNGMGSLALNDSGLGREWRSEERRVGKEGRSRWSPYH